MESYSFYDLGLAEAMYHFVSQDEEYKRFEKLNIEEDVSIAQYCERHFTAFRKYCEDTFHFTVSQP